MNFARYAEYKDSGVQWLGRVPAHWQIVPLKRLVSTPITDGPHETPERVDVGIPFVSAEAVAGGSIDFAKVWGHISVADHLRYSQKYSPQIGDIFIVKSGATTGISAIVETESEFNIWSPLAAIRCNQLAFSRFVLNVVRSRQFREGVELNWSFGTQQNIGMRVIENLPLAIPSIDEQTAIAAFLDRETGKIDALVAEQQKLIALLKEKRQAVISHAVTKGLNPQAPMKPSGIEWLGDVPSHWTVMPIRLAAKLESGHTPSRNHPEYWEDCDVPWFTLADIWQIREAKAECIFDTKEKVSQVGLANSSARLLPKGTVMLSRTASVGFSAVMGVPMATTQDFANWICGPRLLPDFLLYVFRSMAGEFRRLMMGSTHNTIYMPDIQSFRFVLPPVNEQEQIVSHVRQLAASFDDLTAQAESAVQLLNERRSALISAAVTGQIDVRGLTSKAAAEASALEFGNNLGFADT